MKKINGELISLGYGGAIVATKKRRTFWQKIRRAICGSRFLSWRV